MTYILVVDDDLASRQLAEKILRRAGLRVMAVPHVFDAIEAVASEVPAAIALDISMPGMDGWEFLRYLRTKGETASVPVVFVTANALPADRERAFAEGAQGFISKPYPPASLVEAIRAHVPVEGGA